MALPVAIPKEYVGTVVRKEQWSPKVYFLQLSWAKQFAFTEGQYVSFLINNHRRPLSIASAHTEELLDFVIDVSPQGVCSKFIETAQMGDAVRYMAPYGRFVLDEADPRPRLFIATGTGIAPIRSHLKHAIAQNHTQPMTMLFGNISEKHILFHNEFTALSTINKNFTYIPVLSEPSSKWTGHKGLVTHVMLTLPNLTGFTVYLCGHPDMIRDAKTFLLNHNMPEKHIKTEAYTPATN